MREVQSILRGFKVIPPIVDCKNGRVGDRNEIKPKSYERVGEGYNQAIHIP